MSNDDFLNVSDLPNRKTTTESKRSIVEQVKEYRAVNYTCFCGQCHVKRGALIVAGLELLRSAVIVALTIWVEREEWSSATRGSISAVFLFVANIVVSVLLCATVSALFYGLRTENRRWMIAHMIAQPCAFVYLFVVAVYLLTGAGKGKGDSLHWGLGFAAAVAAGAELWFSVVVFKAYKYLRDLAMDAREQLMARAYFSAVKQLLQLPISPDVNTNARDLVNRIQKENVDNVELWMGQGLSAGI